MTASQLISVSPDELRFHFELEKQTFCDLKVLNNTQNHVAFKVKTTSPKKYIARPNTGVVHPWDSCIIRVTLQAQREYPPKMQCKDKFLLLSTIVSPNTDVVDLPQDTFDEESGNSVEKLKFRAAYISTASPEGRSEDDASRSSHKFLFYTSMLDQVMSVTKGATDGISSVSNSIRMLGTSSIQGAVGYGIGFGHGFGLGIAMKSGVDKLQSRII
ncbi:vesicle-associated protein 2-1-like isoform X2 [Vigna radiata var. radiata]|nr:vesicle-associated protein 2-1-like isoform X2 [Vigna radiata var. radiata]